MSFIERQTMLAKGKGKVNIFVVKVMKILRLWHKSENGNGDRSIDKN